MKKAKYHLAYTRDTGLIIQQAWAFGLQNLYRKLVGKKSSYPLVVDFLTDGTIEIYQNKKLVEEIEKAICRANRKNKNFFYSNFDKFKKDILFFESLWNGKGIPNAKQFILLMDRLNHWVEEYIIYYHSATNNNNPKEILDIARKFRQTDDYWSKAAHFLRKSLINLYPKIKGFEDAILQNEVAKIPAMNILVERKKGFVVIGKKNFIGNLSLLPYDFGREVKSTRTMKGQIAFKGKVKGKVYILKSVINTNKIKNGDVLVSPMTTPDMMMAIKKCSAIITDEGGITCHATIVARELKKPCIIGTKIATKVLKDGDLVEVNAEVGTVTILKRSN